MRKISLFLVVMVIFCVSASGFAATLIVSMDVEGGTEKLWIAGSKMRVDSSNDPSYMLFDAKSGTMYSINTEDKEALDMSSVLQGDAKKPGTDKYQGKFVKVGQGPAIAGYATEQYEFTVNGEKCSDEFLSKDALRDIESLDVFEALSKLASSESMDLGEEMLDPCLSAQLNFDKTYQKLGFPLRIVDRDGTQELEVVKITSGVQTPPGFFDVPADYEVVDFGEMMQETMQEYSPQEGEGGTPGSGGAGEPVNPEKLKEMMQQMMQPPVQEK